MCAKMTPEELAKVNEERRENGQMLVDEYGNIVKTMITEYVETGEGDGVSVVLLREKFVGNIDGKQLIADNIDGSHELLEG